MQRSPTRRSSRYAAGNYALLGLWRVPEENYSQPFRRRSKPRQAVAGLRDLDCEAAGAGVLLAHKDEGERVETLHQELCQIEVNASSMGRLPWLGTCE